MPYIVVKVYPMHGDENYGLEYAYTNLTQKIAKVYWYVISSSCSCRCTILTYTR